MNEHVCQTSGNNVYVAAESKSAYMEFSLNSGTGDLTIKNKLFPDETLMH